MSKWSDKYKKSIDCDNPKGFSQKAHCAGKKKSFKEFREYNMTRGFSIGSFPMAKPMASMGGSQFFPNYRSATTMPAMSSSYRGPGLGTMKPMLSASQKFAVNYKGSKNVGKQQTPGGMANIAKQINKVIKVTAKDADAARDIVKKVLDRRVRNDQLRRYDLGVAKAVNEADKRIPRKPGQKAKSDKHSDLYTDEDPRGTIHGLGFTDKKKAKQSLSKIRNSGRTHAHKMQAAIAMSQRAKVASQRAKDPEKKKDLGQAHKAYQSYINKNKKSKD